MVADIDLILNALAAGAGGVATAMAGDAGRVVYERLKDLLLIRLDGRDTALREIEAEKPQREVLEAHLVEVGAEHDRELVETARELLRRLGQETVPASPHVNGGSAARDAFNTIVHGNVFVQGGWNQSGQSSAHSSQSSADSSQSSADSGQGSAGGSRGSAHRGQVSARGGPGSADGGPGSGYGAAGRSESGPGEANPPQAPAAVRMGIR